MLPLASREPEASNCTASGTMPSVLDTASEAEGVSLCGDWLLIITEVVALPPSLSVTVTLALKEPALP